MRNTVPSPSVHVSQCIPVATMTGQIWALIPTGSLRLNLGTSVCPVIKRIGFFFLLELLRAAGYHLPTKRKEATRKCSQHRIKKGRGQGTKFCGIIHCLSLWNQPFSKPLSDSSPTQSIPSFPESYPVHPALCPSVHSLEDREHDPSVPLQCWHSVRKRRGLEREEG